MDFDPNNSHSSSGSGSKKSDVDTMVAAGTELANKRPDLLNKLSEAQVRVLHYLLSGLTEPQIAQHIARSRHTVHDHTKAIYGALNVNSRVQLVLLFTQRM